MIVRTLKNLARRKNKTIVSTIHQPSSQAFSYCDRLILLADGNVVYQGVAKDSATYFNLTTAGKTRRNPCDYFMRELSINYPKKKEDEDKINKYTTKYNNEQAPILERELLELQYGNLDIDRAGRQGKTFGEQLKMVRYRSLLFVKREPQAVFAKIG